MLSGQRLSRLSLFESVHRGVSQSDRHEISLRRINGSVQGGLY